MVLALAASPILPLLVHKEQNLVQHHLELARIFKTYEPTATRKQISNGEIHLFVKMNPVVIHPIDCLLVGYVRLSQSEILKLPPSKP